MSVRWGVACAVAVLFLASGITAGADPGVAPQPATEPDIEYDSTLLRIDLGEDGTADWTIEYRVTLDDQNATDAFEALREDIRANRSTFESQFASRMNRTARAAENATGREMAIRNVSVSTRTDAVAGVVSYSFTWTNFAVASEGEIRGGDAISGLVLDSGTTLSVSWPEEYDAVEVTPGADERRSGLAIWNPPETFGAEEPRLVLERGGGESGIDPTLLGAVAVVILTLVAVGWRFRDRVPRPGSTMSSGGDGRSGGESGAAGGDAPGDDDGGSGEESAPPAELLSNEERVLRLLEENGGRMKQQQVVQELDWTDAKTSQVVGDLRDDGEIEVFRIGRENVLALPGETDF
jgi:hypothetical protein